MNSPCVPSACARRGENPRPAASASPAKSGLEIRRKLHTSRAYQRPATLQTCKVVTLTIRCMAFGRAACGEVEHRTEQQSGAADAERDRRDVAGAFGRVDRITRRRGA